VKPSYFITGGILERFMLRVDKTSSPNGCWLWIGNTDKDGYGTFWFEKKKSRANRVAYLLFKGSIKPKKQILHSCPGGHNKSCVNPAHLRQGTHIENMQDIKTSGNWPIQVGEANHAAKLTADNVLEIKRLLRCGLPQPIIAKKFAITQPLVSKINRGHIWTNV